MTPYLRLLATLMVLAYGYLRKRAFVNFGQSAGPSTGAESASGRPRLEAGPDPCGLRLNEEDIGTSLLEPGQAPKVDQIGQIAATLGHRQHGVSGGTSA